jgi:hypothetical protein
MHETTNPKGSREGSTSTAISTTFASDVMGQHNKIGGINFGAALVYE